MGVVPSAPSGPRRGRRPTISVEFLAQVAEAYELAVERGERPVAAIARRLRIPKTRVPAYVHAARNKYALLTGTEAGQTSGAMTPKCRDILAALRKGRRPSARSRSHAAPRPPTQKQAKPPKRRTQR